MAETILEAHSVSAASGWYFEDFLTTQLDGFRPVVCFALVTTFDPDYLSLPPVKKIVPLTVEDLGEDLGGRQIAAREIVHELELRARLSD